MSQALAPSVPSAGGIHALARRRPITVLLFALLVPVYLAYAAVLITGLPFIAGQLAEIVLLMAAPIVVSSWIGGRAAVRRVFAGLLRGRIGFSRWALALFALPAISLGLALATGTLGTPDGGWSRAATMFAVVLLYSGLTANIWEETVWAGFVQGRLMARHGLLRGSLLSAIPFGVIHLPLAFQNGLAKTTAMDALITWGFMIVMAPFLRYLLGMVTIDTGGSTLAAGFLHASMNASMAMAVLTGGWQPLVALAGLTLAVAGYRSRRGLSAVQGFAPELDLDDEHASVDVAGVRGLR